MTAAAGRCVRCGESRESVTHQMSLWWTHAFVASENAGKPLDHECPDGYYRMHEDGMCRIVRTDGKDRTAPREQEAEGEACPHGGTVWAGSTDCPKCAPEGS